MARNEMAEHILVSLVQRSPDLIGHITDPSEPVIMAAVTSKPGLLNSYIGKLGDKDLLTLISRNEDVIQYVGNPSRSFIEEAIAANGKVIKHLPNAPEEMKIRAVSSAPKVIKFIENPSEAVQAAYLASRARLTNWRDGDIGFRALWGRKGLAEATQMAMVEGGVPLRLIPDPTHRVAMTAIRRNAAQVLAVKEPTRAMRLAALRGDGKLLEHFRKDATPAEQMAAIRQDGRALAFVPSPTRKMRLAAVRQNGGTLFLIPEAERDLDLVRAAACQKPNVLFFLPRDILEKVAVDVISVQPLAIRHIAEPTEDMKLAAVSRNGWAVKFISDPTPEVIETALRTTPEAKVLLYPDVEPTVAPGLR